MHIDLNSCFASIEQQANPLLRGKPVAVAAYNSPGGCILAASVEAKKYGIKTGLRVKEGKHIYPDLIVLVPDPNKYREVHIKFRKIISSYTNHFYPKSIDEFVLHFGPEQEGKLIPIAQEIKYRIRSEIGEWLRVSVGISTNRFLAKTASSLHKPDGLDEISKSNFLSIYKRLSLRDLCGISFQNEARLKSVGINSVTDFYNATVDRLTAAFESILADYWYRRLRGWEIDDLEFSRRSFGNSYALPHSSGKKEELFPILQKLVEKTGVRMRATGFGTTGIHVGIFYRDRSFWHKGRRLKEPIFDSRDIFKEACRILSSCPFQKPVHTLSETCFGLFKSNLTQLKLFEDVVKQKNLVYALDKVNKRWGEFVVSPARMTLAREAVKDRIAFGGVRELL